jgi:hypothetical protein
MVMRLAALILAVAVAASSPAPAAILFASSEDIGFNASAGAIAVSISPGRFRAGYARGVVAAAANAGATDPPANRLLPVGSITAGNLLWVHAQIYDQLNTTVANQQGIIVRSPDGVSRIIVRQTSTYGLVKISTRNAAGTIVDLATASAPYVLSSLTQLDLKIDYSASGGIQLWLGGTQVINWSGDPRTDAATTLNQVEFAQIMGLTNWSEVIIADQDTRAMGLVYLAAGTGSLNQGWTPNTLGNINESTLNDSTFVSDSTGNVLSQWPNGTSLPGTPQVLAVVQEARMRKGGTGPSAFDWSLRTNGADYLAGTTTALTTSFANFNQIWPTNPGTGTGWLPTDIVTGNAFYYGVKSLP